MAQCLAIHPDNPQARLITQAVSALQQGKVIVYPTDCCYALGCQIDSKSALERILRIRPIDTKQPLALMCHDLSQVGHYAQVHNDQFRLLKMVDCSQYTFILEATKAVPNRLIPPKHKTIGVRMSKQAITQALLTELEAPILTCTLWLPADEEPLTDPYDICTRLDHEVDLVIDGGWCGTTPTTVINMTDGLELISTGAGATAPFGL
ncbi:L-threonylcarbamoyladenylate synthase [Neisseriaceae bacterium ESL0693]|nr:L-threonylcarbamoyladenylate synthase [Neisseriaceae bacterium ESL0693]